MSEKSSIISIKDHWIKKVFAIIGSLFGAIILFYILPASQLSLGARSLSAIFVATLILWVTETFDPAVTSLLALVAMPILGVYKDLKGATIGFYGTILFFLIASFVLSTAVEKSGIGRRFALTLLSKTKSGSKVAILVFMIGCAITSSIMSDVPACAIWMSLALPILKKLDIIPGKSNFGKAIMIGIPIAAYIGGVATPAGSGVNILALNLMAVADINVSFIQWMAIGVPMALIMTVVSWFILITVLKPEIESIGSTDQFKEEKKALGKWNNAEIKTMSIMAFALVFWIASSFIKSLDITMVAVIAAIAMFLPGINLLSWKEAEKNIGWGTAIMIGVVSSLGAASIETGLSKWVVVNALGGISNLGIVWITLIISAFTLIIHIPIPINPAIIAAIVPPMLALAKTTGVNGALYALPIAFTTSAAFLLPLDAVMLVTYSKGYYGMRDMFLPGFLISIVWVILMTALIVIVAPVVGLG